MIERIKQEISKFLTNLIMPKYGIVQSYNPGAYTVKVLLQPQQILTGDIPLASQWVGNGFGFVCGPNIGDAATLNFIDGSLQASIVVGRTFNDSARPPVVQSGQMAMVDSKGSFAKLNNDGTITFGAPTGITTTTPLLTQNGNTTFNGNVQVNGGVIATGDVVANGISLDNHDHGGVQSGGDFTDPPTG